MSVQNIYRDNSDILKIYNDIPYSDEQKTAILSSSSDGQDLLKVPTTNSNNIIIKPSLSWIDRFMDFMRKYKDVFYVILFLSIFISLLYYFDDINNSNNKNGDKKIKK